jgi:hypothetical protein
VRVNGNEVVLKAGREEGVVGEGEGVASMLERVDNREWGSCAR